MLADIDRIWGTSRVAEATPPGGFAATLPRGGRERVALTKDDIFHYVYGVLHDPLYREKYALNLKREFPRIACDPEPQACACVDPAARWRVTGDEIMGSKQVPTEKGRQASASLHSEAAKDERKTEAETGKPLKKGEERFEERSKSSDGKSAGEKQR